MKIPVWLATILVTSVIGGAGVSYEWLRADMREMRNDVHQLQVDVAVIKAAREKPSVAYTGPAADGQ